MEIFDLGELGALKAADRWLLMICDPRPVGSSVCRPVDLAGDVLGVLISLDGVPSRQCRPISPQRWPPFLVGWFVKLADLERLRGNSCLSAPFYLLFIHHRYYQWTFFFFLLTSRTVWNTLIFSSHKTAVWVPKLSPCTEKHTATHAHRGQPGRPRAQPSGADKVQLASLARFILLLRGHQGWRGPLMGGGNWCQKWEISPPLFLLRLSTYSVSQEGSRCHKKSIKSTSNYPGNWQWNWKSLWPRRQPIPHHLHPKIPAVWQRRFRYGDVLFPVPTLFATITFTDADLIISHAIQSSSADPAVCEQL